MDQHARAKANTFRALHHGEDVLILANAWDAGSARLIESCGAKAIATSSAALAWSCGYADSGAIPPRVLADAVRGISRVLTVPLSVDAEQGYADDAPAVAQTIAMLIDAGAAGINIEDGSDAPATLAAKIAAIKTEAAARGVDLFVNARTDVILRGLVPADQVVDEVARRARLYREAGCDGLFVPRLADMTTVQAIVAAVDPLPLNPMAVPGLPPASTLRALGVRRLSAGSGLSEATLGYLRRLASEFLIEGASDRLFTPDNLSWSGMNALFPKDGQS